MRKTKRKWATRPRFELETYRIQDYILQLRQPARQTLFAVLCGRMPTFRRAMLPPSSPRRPRLGFLFVREKHVTEQRIFLWNGCFLKMIFKKFFSLSSSTFFSFCLLPLFLLLSHFISCPYFSPSSFLPPSPVSQPKGTAISRGITARQDCSNLLTRQTV